MSCACHMYVRTCVCVGTHIEPSVGVAGAQCRAGRRVGRVCPCGAPDSLLMQTYISINITVSRSVCDIINDTFTET